MSIKSLHPSPQLVFEEQQGVVVAPSHKQIISLYKKSENSGIPFDALVEVFKRGFAITESEQDAFNRVNSFIAGGKAANMDKDIVEKRGLWDNIHAKRERIKHGSGEHMRKPGTKGAPTADALKASQSEETVNEIISNRKMTPAEQKAHAAYLAKHKQKVSSMTTSDDKAKKTFSDYNKEPPVKEPSELGLKRSIGAGYHKEEYTGAEPVSKNMEDPSSRFTGTTQLTNVYKSMTPGQNTIKTIKKVVKEAALKELDIRDASGTIKHVKNVGIRMANGKIKSLPPGKSGSSGGGGE